MTPHPPQGSVTEQDLEDHTTRQDNPHVVDLGELADHDLDAQDLVDGARTIWDASLDGGSGAIALAALATLLDATDDIEPEHLANALQDPGAYPGKSVILGSGWQQPSTTRPALVQIYGNAIATSTTRASISVETDPDGDGTKEMTHLVKAEAGLTSAGRKDVVLFFLPPGGQYQVTNDSDPNNSNHAEATEYIL